MKQTEKKCKGKCPYCNSKNIDWYETDLQDSFIVYSAQCNDCDTWFYEEHKLIYQITVISQP